MTIKCTICRVNFEDIKGLFSHNKLHTPEKLKYILSTCILCAFSHEDPAVTKTHCDIVHKNKGIAELYICHNRLISPSVAAERQRNLLPSPDSSILNKLRHLNMKFAFK